MVRDHGQLAAASGVSGVLTLGILDLIILQSTRTRAAEARVRADAPASGSFVRAAVAAMELNQVTLPALNVAASVAFYRAMGFELVVDAPHYTRFKSTVGNATFSVHAVQSSLASRGMTPAVNPDVPGRLALR